MSGWRPFGYKGEPETCLWCGKRLYRKTVIDEDEEKRLIASGIPRGEAFNQALVPADKLGAYQDDLFCTMRCGYQFGVRMAELGHRLQLPVSKTSTSRNS